MIKVQGIIFWCWVWESHSFLAPSLDSNQTRSKPKLTTVWGNWAHFRAVALQFVPGHVFTRQQSGQYGGLQLRTSWHPLFTNSTQSAVSIDHLCLSFTTFLFPLSFLLVTTVRSFSPLQCPWKVERQEQTQFLSCLTVFRRESLASWQWQEPWGKSLSHPAEQMCSSSWGALFPAAPPAAVVTH